LRIAALPHLRLFRASDQAVNRRNETGTFSIIRSMGHIDLRRREFLTRTAAAAGIAATTAAALDSSTILAEAAKRAARRSELPSPRNCPIEHVVVLMMENRSFDHYFGWLQDEADATQDMT
jgi:phospholipase C